MYSPAFIVAHWQEQHKVFLKNLEILKDHPDKDAVHDIRVAIKKLKAILELYIFLTAEKLWENPLNETETLFKVLGRQRDIDICLENLKKSVTESGFSFHELSSFFELVLKKARQWSSVAVRQYDENEIGRIKVLLKSEETQLTNEVTLQKAMTITTSQLLEARQLLKLPHQLRQHLKKIFYWVRMLPGKLPVAIHEKELHEITDDLGLWQDNEIFLARLRHFRKDYLPKTYDEYGQLGILALEIRNANKLLLGKALRKTRKLLKTVALNENEKVLS
jgi:CHAD domain-containing protein